MNKASELTSARKLAVLLFVIFLIVSYIKILVVANARIRGVRMCGAIGLTTSKLLIALPNDT